MLDAYLIRRWTVVSADPVWERDEDMDETRPLSVPISTVWGNRSPLIRGVAKVDIASWGAVDLCCRLEAPQFAHRKYLRAATCITMVYFARLMIDD